MLAPQRRVLITGGNGYVGRCLVRSLLRAFGPADRVCVLDAQRYGGWSFGPEGEDDRLLLRRGDIRDAAAVAEVVGAFRPDVVVHLAAIHFIPECERDPALAVSTNVQGAVAVLQACPPGARFVLASSGAVYRPDDRPHDEAAAEVGPNDIYGLSKLHAEQYTRAIAAARGLAAVVVRLFNVIGPGETNPHLLPELVAQLKAGRRVVEIGNLSPRRDYISVQDAANGFRLAALAGAVAPGETVVVNLGTAVTHSVAEILDKLRAVSGIDFEVRQDAARVRPVDRPVLAADNRRIGELFGWRAERSLDETLAELWARPDLAPRLTERYR